jgi:CHAD domain-containing protein
MTASLERERKSKPRRRDVAVPQGNRHARAIRLVGAAIGSAVDQFVRLDPQLRTAPDAKVVHDARVAVRTLRSHLRTFEPIVDAPWSRDLEGRLRWLSDCLSGARDEDVILAELRERVRSLRAEDRAEAETVLEKFARRREGAYAQLATALAEPRYVELVDAIIRAARAPHLRPRAEAEAARLVRDLMKPVWKRLRKAVRACDSPPDDRALHRIRRRAKHARYAAEAFVPIVGARAKCFVLRMKHLQSELGKQHDAVNVLSRLREVSDGPQAAFVIGELAALEERIATEGVLRWPGLWRCASQKSLRFWR